MGFVSYSIPLGFQNMSSGDWSVQNPSFIPLYWLVKNGIPLLDYYSPQYIG